MREKLLKYKKPLIISLALVVLNLIYGFDARFTIINLIWLLL